MKRKVVAITVLMLSAILLGAVQVRPVSATDYSSSNKLSIDAQTYTYQSWQLSTGNGIYGNFTKEDNQWATAGIDFFICDSAAFDNWTSGKTASVYNLQSKVTSYNWTFSVLYSDTWYFVYNNKYNLLSTIYVDTWLCRDDTAPTITISNAPTNNSKIQVPSGSSNYVWGNVIASAKDNIQLSSFTLYLDGSKVATNASITYSLVVGSLSGGNHTLLFDALDWANHETTETIIFDVVQPSTGGGGGGGGGGGYATLPLDVIALGSIAALVVVALVALVFSRSRKGQRAEAVEPTSKPTRKVAKPTREEAPESGAGFCPNCGAKLVAGATFCKNCGASVES